MTQSTFGRRGLASKPLPAPQFEPVPRAVASYPEPVYQLRYSAQTEGRPTERAESEVLARIPFFTFALVIAFFVGFSMQQRFAFTANAKGAFDTTSLVAMGAASYDLVVGKGDWWRIFLAPLLHGSFSHMTGNVWALLIAGFRLEPMLGRWWFLTIFCVSALGGMSGSLGSNPAAVVTVGASGGISGLLGALFVASFHHKADELSNRKKMRRTALFFGLPALLPVFFNVQNGVDYAAHAGGAITGAVIAIILCEFWPGDERRPRGSFAILLVPVAYFSLATIGLGYAARGYRGHAQESIAERATYIPDDKIPTSIKLSDKETADLVSRYPKDPRAHLLRGYSLAVAGRYSAAEYELRTGLDLFTPDLRFGGKELIRALLSADLVAQGRMTEARDVAAPLCPPSRQTSEIANLLTDSHVCEVPKH